MANSKLTRIALFGNTGVGKSSLGNTLTGKDNFIASASSLSVTHNCETAEVTLESGRRLKVVDTPGIIDSNGDSKLVEVKSFFEFLAPGPHAIIIVITASRHTDNDNKVMAELRAFFGDDSFLDFTILVMVRKNDILGKLGESTNIHEFIENKASANIKKLYKGCGKRIVAVDNKQDWVDRQKDAEELLNEIDMLDGYYAHKFFSKIHEVNKMMDENDAMQSKIAELEKKNKELEDKCDLM